jgi:S1-C subfamily serine protease
MKVSDLIVSIDGQNVDDPNGFDYRFATRPLGGTAQVDVRRQNVVIKLKVPLEVAPDTGRDEIELKSRSPFQGARVANISPALADELRLDSNVEGVVVTAVADNALASNVGFQKGDIITAVNGKTIAKTSDLEQVTSEPARLWRITIIRGGQRINVTLGG